MRIIGSMIVGPGEAGRYLAASLDELKRLTDRALIVLNNVDKETEEMVFHSGFDFYYDNREWGIHQPIIKEKLARSLGKFNPDWILYLDADEVFGADVTRETLEELANKNHVAWYFFFINLWNDDQHHRRALAFWNVRFWKYAQEYGLQFEKKNLHCGSAPRWAYHHGVYAPYIIKHYGLMKPSERERKVERYKLYDPHAKFKSRAYYETLASKDVPDELDEDVMMRLVREEVKSYKQETPKMIPMTQQIKYFYVMREDGSVVDIPEKHLAITMNNHRNWKILSEITTAISGDLEIIDDVEEEVATVMPTALLCDKCGFVPKSTRALKVHNTKKHKL